MVETDYMNGFQSQCTLNFSTTPYPKNIPQIL